MLSGLKLENKHLVINYIYYSVEARGSSKSKLPTSRLVWVLGLSSETGDTAKRPLVDCMRSSGQRGCNLLCSTSHIFLQEKEGRQSSNGADRRKGDASRWGFIDQEHVCPIFLPHRGKKSWWCFILLAAPKNLSILHKIFRCCQQD